MRTPTFMQKPLPEEAIDGIVVFGWTWLANIYHVEDVTRRQWLWKANRGLEPYSSFFRQLQFYIEHTPFRTEDRRIAEARKSDRCDITFCEHPRHKRWSRVDKGAAG